MTSCVSEFTHESAAQLPGQHAHCADAAVFDVLVLAVLYVQPTLERLCTVGTHRAYASQAQFSAETARVCTITSV